MADNPTVKEITDKIEAGVKDLYESEKYADYLRTMSRFHRYSARNIMLIHLQKPDATHVAGYQSWKNKFKRQVKRGEHGIKILAPAPFIIKEEKEILDPLTKKPIINEYGEPLHEEIEIKTARFKVASVFDISQTVGEPLPQLAETLTGDVERYELFMDALKAISPLPVVFEYLPPDTDGTCTFGDKIRIREGMSEIQTVSATIHEIAHAK
ncbi:MAG: ArdC-like ssDNA-binding domain-containing protein, partial [Treponema sp.]|nr:ArdC-like ssDNA-binding domain-containing protein [Treponema sp.]